LFFVCCEQVFFIGKSNLPATDTDPIRLGALLRRMLGEVVSYKLIAEFIGTGADKQTQAKCE